MSNFSYVFGDVLTGQVIAEIPLYGVSMTRGFGMGEFRGSFQLDQTGMSNRDLINATQEGRCYLVCERENEAIWGGFVKTRTYQGQAKSYQLFALAWEHYPEYRFMRRDAIDYVNAEQLTIFIDLWSIMMSDDPNSIQFTLPTTAVTVTKNLSAKGFEFVYYRELMDQLANADDGFDWTVDIARVENVYSKSLRIGYPTLGASNPVDFDYPGQIVNYWHNGSMADRGTHFYGVGAGEGSTMLTQEVIHSDLISSGFPRYDQYVSLKSISDPTILAGLTTQRAIVKKPGIPTLTVELKADQLPQFGSYGLGDAARVNFTGDPRHPDPVDQIFNTRILGWEYYPPQDTHTEMARIVFEGEQ